MIEKLNKLSITCERPFLNNLLRSLKISCLASLTFDLILTVGILIISIGECSLNELADMSLYVAIFNLYMIFTVVPISVVTTFFLDISHLLKYALASKAIIIIITLIYSASFIILILIRFEVKQYLTVYYYVATTLLILFLAILHNVFSKNDYSLRIGKLRTIKMNGDQIYCINKIFDRCIISFFMAILVICIICNINVILYS